MCNTWGEKLYRMYLVVLSGYHICLSVTYPLSCWFLYRIFFCEKLFSHCWFHGDRSSDSHIFL